MCSNNFEPNSTFDIQVTKPKNMQVFPACAISFPC